ncbi:hypothetical protein DM01DRAFT_1338411 [Hesseltinella vesiculosa]|uniref:Uncharacterized protein n=1 Tax=Hesseltinella vesiculosa TaxID=101127 RepID=A0A1X2G9X8_9FUNG|nr:hypothetical protein DM01DRAFT_1338411 [Hesseltinella vesiculosa]
MTSCTWLHAGSIFCYPINYLVFGRGSIRQLIGDYLIDLMLVKEDLAGDTFHCSISTMSFMSSMTEALDGVIEDGMTTVDGLVILVLLVLAILVVPVVLWEATSEAGIGVAVASMLVEESVLVLAVEWHDAQVLGCNLVPGNRVNFHGSISYLF